MDTIDKLSGVILAIAAACILMALGSALGKRQARYQMKLEAVKAGCAEFWLDNNYQRQFSWKTNYLRQ